MSGAIRYCDRCQLVKPDRCHHCSVCDKGPPVACRCCHRNPARATLAVSSRVLQAPGAEGENVTDVSKSHGFHDFHDLCDINVALAVTL
ncbi:Palmitoyltransferase ZDHHC2 [Chelonia mydas]|uniref:Palmitoyltransferase ZDHHC2 n=1 Tax=Chelonia mydas TaxID=8469 RepID=M7BYD0_CHEMY|nr:Palmitoyltransferase ZDHHC2 [Chelonia mydas]